MRIVLDTNLLVSALISSQGPPAELFDLWGEDRYELVTSISQLRELERVLAYPRLAKRLPTDLVEAVLFRLANSAILATDLPSVEQSSDPDDNRILATAIAGKADLIASGNRKHVLPLRAVEGIPIVTAVEAISLLTQQSQ